MMVLMNQEATPDQVEDVVARIEDHHLQALRLPGDEHTAIGVASAIPPDVREPLTVALSALPGVDHVVQISRPYKLASREFHRVDTVINIKGVSIGGNRCVIMAGPCSVENRDQIFASARAVQAAGAKSAARRRVQTPHFALRLSGFGRGGPETTQGGRG